MAEPSPNFDPAELLKERAFNVERKHIERNKRTECVNCHQEWKCIHNREGMCISTSPFADHCTHASSLRTYSGELCGVLHRHSVQNPYLCRGKQRTHWTVNLLFICPRTLSQPTPVSCNLSVHYAYCRCAAAFKNIGVLFPTSDKSNQIN